MKQIFFALVVVVLNLNLKANAAPLPAATQADYESFFSCIKKLVPSAWKTGKYPKNEDYQLAKSYLQTLAVEGDSIVTIKNLNQDCQSKKEIPRELISRATLEQTSKVEWLLQDYIRPRLLCKKVGIDGAIGGGPAISGKIQGAKCTSSIGESWYQVILGGGLGLGAGYTLTVGGGRHQRNGEDDDGDGGLRITAGLGVSGSINLDMTKAEGTTEMRSVKITNPITAAGAGAGVGLLGLAEGQFAIPVYRGRLRVDYLLHRLGVSSPANPSVDSKFILN